jgi:hypothetical protein
MIHGYWPDEIDHINGDRADNRLSNLREVSNIENQRNKVLPRNNKSGHIGVSWNKDSKKWMARITINYKLKQVGQFSTIEEAVAARKEAERKFGFSERHGARGPYYKPNKPAKHPTLKGNPQ